MFGKMAGFAEGFKAVKHEVGQGIRADKYIRKGMKQPNPASANADGLFSNGIRKAKQTSIGTKLTANTGYKIKTEKLTDDMMDSLSASGRNLKAQSAKIATEMEDLPVGDARAVLGKQREAIREKSQRVDGMLEKGSFQREATMREYASDYFNDEAYGDFRKKAAIGVGAAAGVGMLAGRFATGGSLTRNGNGDRDIVGIPLI